MTYKQAFYRVVAAYRKGIVEYPRVENDYLASPRFSFFPHPPLKPFDTYATPLSRASYELTFSTLPLLLANEKVSSPATLVRLLEWAEKVYDEKLRFKDEAVRAEVERKLSAMMEHLAAYVTPETQILTRDGFVDTEKISFSGKTSYFPMDIRAFAIPVPYTSDAAGRARGEEGRRVKWDDKPRIGAKLANFSGLRAEAAEDIAAAKKALRRERLVREYLRRKAEEAAIDALLEFAVRRTDEEIAAALEAERGREAEISLRKKIKRRI